MHNLLTRYFNKLKLDPAKLQEHEKKTFDEWEVTLAPKEVTADSIADWCEQLRSNLEEKGLETEAQKQAFLNLGKIVRFIRRPDKEREALEKHIQDLIDAIPD